MKKKKRLPSPNFDSTFPGAPCYSGISGSIFIYVLIDPRSESVVYVGKTNNADRRFWQHIEDPHSFKLRKWQKSLRRKRLSPRMVVVDSADESNWRQCERDWIKYYRSLGDILNIEDGG